MSIGYIQKNPSSACTLPRVTQTEIHPLDTPELITLPESIKGHEYEALIKVAIFTGMRSGELLGLTWGCVDFGHGMIRKGESFRFGTLKNDKPRTLTPAPFVMNGLRKHRVEQLDQKKKAGIARNDGGFRRPAQPAARHNACGMNTFRAGTAQRNAGRCAYGTGTLRPESNRRMQRLMNRLGQGLPGRWGYRGNMMLPKLSGAP